MPDIMQTTDSKLTYMFIDHMCNVASTLTDFQHIYWPYSQRYLMITSSELNIYSVVKLSANTERIFNNEMQ